MFLNQGQIWHNQNNMTERGESAREQKTGLYKNDQQQQQCKGERN